jgi:hypothetical protein
MPKFLRDEEGHDNTTTLGGDRGPVQEKPEKGCNM